MRARVIDELARKGMDADALAVALASGELTLDHLESAGRRHPRSDRTYAQAAGDLGIGFATLQRIIVAFGFVRPEPDDHVRQEDLEALAALPLLLGAGISEPSVVQFARVFGDTVRKVAQFQVHFFHATIEEPFRQRGLRDNEAFEAALREVGLRAGRSGEHLLTWLFRKHAESYGLEHQFGHVETALERAGVRVAPSRSPEGVAFADLTGYTRLTEEAGDAVAADVSLRLADLVNELAAAHRGHVIKMLGDGVHFHFRDPADAVAASLELVAAVHGASLPPAHIGVNAGPMIYDEGDYFGRTVNIAARIAGQAAADQVFVGEDVTTVVEPRGYAFVVVGAVALKGIAEPVLLFEAVRA
jgi:adenylate cyclase